MDSRLPQKQVMRNSGRLPYLSLRAALTGWLGADFVAPLHAQPLVHVRTIVTMLTAITYLGGFHLQDTTPLNELPSSSFLILLQFLCLVLSISFGASSFYQKQPRGDTEDV